MSEERIWTEDAPEYEPVDFGNIDLESAQVVILKDAPVEQAAAGPALLTCLLCTIGGFVLGYAYGRRKLD